MGYEKPLELLVDWSTYTYAGFGVTLRKPKDNFLLLDTYQSPINQFQCAPGKIYKIKSDRTHGLQLCFTEHIYSTDFLVLHEGFEQLTNLHELSNA
ncbi:uncharacterized protein H6S33_001071 [Morchella sextelata]|uniref:uncharacterized protein n=1 Tax=Morchella sextelata TaxID=1174677 RepID=UPI001D053C1B|nr:uncharacterized protein H6S33_001071 [Morchella sextelata]KAH0608843.1 hypothetical protein H6S33_001071 [Morchella sextelata]